jgi:hypothetical protein
VTAQHIDIRGTLDLAGNAGTFSGNVSLGTTGALKTSGTITLNGSSDQTIDIENSGAEADRDFQNLTISAAARTVTVADNSLANPGFVVGGTLSLGAGATLLVQENARFDGDIGTWSGTLSIPSGIDVTFNKGTAATHSGTGTLTMAGPSARLLISNVAAHSVSIGTLRTTGGAASQPAITATGAGSARYAFTVTQSLDVTGLRFTGTGTPPGLRYVDFASAPTTGSPDRLLTVESAGPVSLAVLGSTFDATGDYNVYAVDTNGGDDVRVFTDATDNGAASPAGESREFDDYGQGGDESVQLSPSNPAANTSRVDWLTTITGLLPDVDPETAVPAFTSWDADLVTDYFGGANPSIGVALNTNTGAGANCLNPVQNGF